MSWANIEFVGAVLALLVAWVVFDRPHRDRRVEHRGLRRQRRADEARIAARRQADLDVLYRHYRTMVRYYQAGHDPGELSPPRLPGRGAVPAPTARRSPSSSSNQSPSR